MQFKAEIDDHAGLRVVRLAGRLQREHADALVRLCEDAPPPLRLDLTDLVSADPAGLQTLLLIQERGARLESASPYVALQLEGARQ